MSSEDYYETCLKIVKMLILINNSTVEWASRRIPMWIFTDVSCACNNNLFYKTSFYAMTEF